MVMVLLRKNHDIPADCTTPILGFDVMPLCLPRYGHCIFHREILPGYYNRLGNRGRAVASSSDNFVAI